MNKGSKGPCVTITPSAKTAGQIIGKRASGNHFPSEKANEIAVPPELDTSIPLKQRAFPTAIR